MNAILMLHLSVLMAITRLRVTSTATSVQSIGLARTKYRFTLIKSTVANSEACGDLLPLKLAVQR